MPTLEFKGKQHIYAHHLTVPYRPLEPDKTRSCNPTDTDDNPSFTAITGTPSRHYFRAMPTVSNVSISPHPTTPATRDGSITTTTSISMGANALETNDDGLFHSDDQNDLPILLTFYFFRGKLSLEAEW